MNNNEDIKWAMAHCYDMGCYPEVFDENIGMDFHLDSHPEWYPSLNFWHEKRQCVIKITTYRGFCWNAIHYYADIEADGISVCEDEIDENGKKKTWSHSGCFGDEFDKLPIEKKAEYSHVFHIEITRPVTKEEIDEDNDRWFGYEVGSKTNAFTTIEEAKETALKVANIRFPKGWEIIVNVE